MHLYKLSESLPTACVEGAISFEVSEQHAKVYWSELGRLGWVCSPTILKGA